jgi:hypothetical protein
VHRCLAAALRSLRGTLIASITVVSAEAAVAQVVPRPRSACTVREASRTPLVVDGTREMYIEPTAVLPSRGEILFAGTPNYLWTSGGPRDARDFVRDSVFGVVTGADGRGRLVPGPIDATRIVDVHGVALSDGGWSVAFAELKEPSRPPARDTVIRYWHGVFDGRSWVRLEPLPSPPAGELRTAGASNVLVQGDTTFFAVRVQNAGAGHDIVLYERREGKWALTMVPQRASAYAQLTYSDSTGLLLGIVRPDSSLRRDVNSLFLHARAASWTTSRKLLPGDLEPVHGPVFGSSSEGPVLTWMAILPDGRQTARATVGALDSRNHVLTIDSTMSHFVHVPGLRAGPLWITEHVGSSAASTLRFVGLAPDGEPAPLMSALNPYTGFFGAAATGPDEVTLSGPLLRSDPPNPSLVTLLIRARVECASRAP